MFLMKRLFCLAALAAALLGHTYTAQAAGAEFGVGQTDESTMTYRLGMQFDWDKSWWQSDVGRLTGYWSGAYTYWEGDKASSNHSLSFSPVFVYEFAGQNVKPYIEAGIGVALFENTQVENNQLGTAFQFEDRIGLGLRSEEHTSELQSLMRISYAVFCLKKNTTYLTQYSIML